MKSVNEDITVIKNGWDTTWENKIYGLGRHLNLYPHHSVVSFLMRKFPQLQNRTKIRVLEVGCGAGNNLWFAAREGFQVAGIDGASSAIEFAEKRFEQDGLKGDLRVGDFQSLDWDSGIFDIVIDRQSVLCNRLDVIEQTFDEVKRVLKRGGTFFSMMYSDRHPEIVNGRHLGDNSYDNFRIGYFKDCGIVHFSPVDEIKSIYGDRFDIKSLTHVAETQFDCETWNESPHNGYWRVECLKND